MPLYTILAKEGGVPDHAKARIAEDITSIHTAVMNVPRNFVRVVFLAYQESCGYAAGAQAPVAVIDCTLRDGHTTEEKADLLTQLWTMFQRHTGVATEHLAISLRETPATDAMEFGRIMPPVGKEFR